ncbi:hypothetical protein RHSIM_Rhsim06G0208300 [Rhododendron simsii]|uniref:Multiprotein bridging factor 1 N-terminal domain-containing protein n=1 Tax=Rhododendron simsii TaxID=118357 RepID=A0A834GX55_RHOSS|nr:hypothetical protein RHSIM_Rhsim06G0208300 [Rhododendron simsii]
MDPHCEQILRDEVIFVHSHWHHQKPTTKPTHNPPTLLQTPKPNPTKFKKQKKKRPKPKKLKKISPQPDPPRVSGPEWPCPSFPDPPSSAFEWPVLKLNPAPATRPPSAEEQARFGGTQVQQKALRAAQEFFVDKYKFFVKVFEEDGELRGFYERNCESGEFCCLVCGGIGKKVGKRFKGCVALVQHSNGIAKTKKRRAHRAFAQVVCKVLGWDIDRLPTSGLSSAKSGECQGSAEVGMEGVNMLNQNPVMENGINADMVLKEVSNVDQELRISTVPAVSIGAEQYVMFIESRLNADDADMCMENLDSGYLSTVDGKTEIVVNCLSYLKVEDANMCTENHDCGDLTVVDGKTEGLVNCLDRKGIFQTGIGPISQDWEPVVIRKKAPTAAARKDEKAVNAARRAGAEIETIKKCQSLSLSLYFFQLLIACDFSSSLDATGGSNKAASSSTSLNTRKLDEETENLSHDRVPTELKKAIMQARQDKKLTQAQLAQVSLFLSLS